jgi:hypothetical protein
MPDDQKTNAFKPAQPSIPGVPSEAQKSGPADPPTSWRGRRSLSPTWIVAAAVAALSVGGALLAWHRSPSPPPAAATEPPAAAPVNAVPAGEPREDLPVGPGPIATTEQLVKPWASRRFLFPDSVSADPVPAMVVHLPGGSYWAFSLREPYGTCSLDYVTDLKKLRSEYHFLAAHPMVVDPCTHTVYDLLRYGGPPDGGLVRGDVVQGTGLRPPIAIEVRVSGRQLVAVRAE